MKNISELHIFDRLTRPIFRQKFGSDAPPYDPANPIKRWTDPSPPVNPVYRTVDANGQFVEFALTAEEARAVNLPGVVVYPKYEVAPTPARVIDYAGRESPLNPEHLSHRHEADAIAADLGLTASAVREIALAGAFGFVWNGEQRRVWLIDLPDGPHNVGALLAMKNRNGVGSPGKWEVTPEGPQWHTTVVENTVIDPRPEVPMPMRELRPDEKLRQTFAGWVIVDAGTMTDREMLEDIHRILVEMSSGAKRLGE